MIGGDQKVPKKKIRDLEEPPLKPVFEPAKTVEEREDQMIGLAVSLAEQQLRDGTASAQVITHFLKLGTTKANLEREKLERENELLRAKTDNLQSMKRMEDMYIDAMNAMKTYSGSLDVMRDE